jgi:hypothetical protein
MITDAQAVKLADQAIVATKIGSSGATGPIVSLFACSAHESQFGFGWHGSGKDSHNQGAIQCGGWTGDRFVYVDTHPNADGTSTRYSSCFRKYPGDPEGWADLAKVMYTGRRRTVLDAALREDWAGVSAEMKRTGYYEGFGKTDADRVVNHLRAMMKGVKRALAVLGAPDVVLPPSAIVEIPLTIRYGSVGEAVKLAQRNLKVAADGIFGRVTAVAVRKYQTEHGLTVDGVVGNDTWKALLTDDYVPEAA